MKRLGDMLRGYRAVKNISLRTLSKDMKISISSLSRIERGLNPTGTTLARVINWMTGVFH